MRFIKRLLRRWAGRHVKIASVRLPLQTRASTVVRAVDADGLLLFEGDIAIRPHPNDQIAHPGQIIAEAIAIPGTSFRWPNQTIPFEIASGPTQDIKDAIVHWEQRTNIRFKAHTNETDFAVFQSSARGSDSEVGRRGGSQIIHVFNSASIGEIIHEIGHCVGLWHEHSRSDRNQFVTIDLNNVRFPFEVNFDQHITDGDDIGPYDYGSIMHYGEFDFAIDNHHPTITPKQTGAAIGQRIGLSAGDIAAVTAMYP
jgi:hypothetical protein